MQRTINASDSVDSDGEPKVYTMEMNIYFYELNLTQGSEIRENKDYHPRHFKGMESLNLSSIATIKMPYAAGT